MAWIRPFFGGDSVESLTEEGLCLSGTALGSVGRERLYWLQLAACNQNQLCFHPSAMNELGVTELNRS